MNIILALVVAAVACVVAIVAIATRHQPVTPTPVVPAPVVPAPVVPAPVPVTDPFLEELDELNEEAKELHNELVLALRHQRNARMAQRIKDLNKGP